MTKLQTLQPFQNLFEQIKHSLFEYNSNLQNDLFEIDSEEQKESLYRKGETIFDQVDDNLNNLRQILQKEYEMFEFFNKCKENEEKLIEYKNEIINKLLRIRKNNSTKEEYLNYREEWNKRREESPDVKNRRECEEMLEDMKEEQKKIEEMKQEVLEMKQQLENERELFNKEMDNLRIERQELSFQSEFDAIALEFVRKDEIPETMSREFYRISLNEMNQLEEWTGLKCRDVIFNTDGDEWDLNQCDLLERIIGRRQLIFLIEEENGEKFGYYLNSLIEEEYYTWMETDEYSFLFNLESNGRLEYPMKFGIKDYKRGGYRLAEPNANWIIEIGNISLFKEDIKQKTNCWQNKDVFEYYDIENALCGKEKNELGFMYIVPKRILILQMM